jgi:hypothetical protein
VEEAPSTAKHAVTFNIKENSTFGKSEFQMFSLLCELSPAVILQSDNLSIIKADGSKSVGSGAQSIAGLESNVINNGFSFAF